MPTGCNGFYQRAVAGISSFINVTTPDLKCVINKNLNSNDLHAENMYQFGCYWTII